MFKFIGKRWLSIPVLTGILGIVVLFLMSTSENPQWGSGYWEDWLVRHFHYSLSWANFLVNRVRKGLHFLGYGGIGLLCWAYFHCWGLKKSLRVGLILTALIAVSDELMQSRTTFRYGKPTDVLLDICGAAVVSGAVWWKIQKRKKLNEVIT